MDIKKNKIYVTKSSKAKPPAYFSGGGKLHPRIADKMMEILCSEHSFAYMNEEGNNELNDHRKKYYLNRIHDNQRVIWITRNLILFESYTGTKIAQTLVLMLRSLEIEARVHDSVSRIVWPASNIIYDDVFWQIRSQKWVAEDLIQYVKENERFVSKYSPCIPEVLVDEMHIEHEMDIDGAMQYLQQKELVYINSFS